MTDKFRDENGVSRTRRPGQFRYQRQQWSMCGVPGVRVRWEYRAKNGKLWSGMAYTLAGAVEQAERYSGDKIEEWEEVGE